MRNLAKFKTILSANSLLIVSLLIAMVSGYSISYFSYAKPRGFTGDFSAAMYGKNWWDGKGIFYGPIFVFERWMVDFFTTVATIEFFAIGCILLLVLGLLITISTTKARGSLLVFCIAAWSLNTFYFYSFSVASNPEILELFFLLSMWWSLTNKHLKLAYFVFTCAVLTKLAPAILAPLLLLFFSWSALALSFIVALLMFSLVSIGQNQSFMESLMQTLKINPVDPQPTSEQFLGLNSALARLLGMNPNSNFHTIEIASTVLLLAIYSSAILVLVSSLQTTPKLEHKIAVTYFFALFMSMLPMMHLGQTHRHTFLFLTPVFVAMQYLISQIKDVPQRRRYRNAFYLMFLAYSFLPIYALDFYNFDDLSGMMFLEEFKSSFVMFTEPIWLNILLVAGILNYGNRVLNLRIKLVNFLSIGGRKSRFWIS